MKIIRNKSFLSSVLLCSLIASGISIGCFGRQTSEGASELQKEHILNPALFFSVEKEIQERPLNKIIGDIPDWLEGSFCHLVPAKYSSPHTQTKINEWFMGLSMIEKVAFSKGKATYSNAFLRSQDYQRYYEAGLDLISETAKASNKAVLPIRNANVNISIYNNTPVALTEIPLPVAFSPKTLVTEGVFLFDDALPRSRVFESAHPILDPETQDIYNLSIDYGWPSRLKIWSMKSASNSRTQIASIPSYFPAYMHSFALSKRFVILIENNMRFDVQKLMKGEDFFASMDWREDLQSRIWLVEKKTHTIYGPIPIQNLFYFHAVNAFENNSSIQCGDELIIDIVSYKLAPPFAFPNVQEQVALGSYKSELSQPNLSRIRIPLKNLPRFSEENFTLKSDTVPDSASLKKADDADALPLVASLEVLWKDIPCEMPRIHEKEHTKPTSWIWATHMLSPASKTDHDETSSYLVAFHLPTMKSSFWSEPGCAPGEPVFVEAVSVGAENPTLPESGALLSYVLNYKKHESFLLILNPYTMEEYARIMLPQASPLPLHGVFLAP